MNDQQIYNPEYRTQSDDPVPMGRYELMARVEVLEEALSKISELQFSDADEPLDDAIAFARDALNGNKP